MKSRLLVAFAPHIRDVVAVGADRAALIIPDQGFIRQNGEASWGELFQALLDAPPAAGSS